jgi:hypothetical protein
VSSISKEVVGKVTFEEAEKLMIRFQKDIFVKLNQERGELEGVENRLNKLVENTAQDLQAQLG